MSTTRVSDLLDRLLDPLVQTLSSDTARAILSLEADENIHSRMEELAEKCTEGKLTPPEEEEYETYVRVSNLIAILKAKARLVLDQTVQS